MKDENKRIIRLLIVAIVLTALLAFITLLQIRSLSTEDIRPVSTEQVDPPGSGVKIGASKDKAQ